MRGVLTGCSSDYPATHRRRAASTPAAEKSILSEEGRTWFREETLSLIAYREEPTPPSCSPRDLSDVIEGTGARLVLS